MKICNCGYQNEDNDNFCKQCGSPLEAQKQTAPPPMAETVPPMAGQQATPPPMTTGYQQSTSDVQQPAANPFPMLTALKAKGGSAAFLVATILFTITLVFTLVSSFNVRATLADAVNTINAYAGISGVKLIDTSQIYEVIYQITPLLIVVSIVSSIPTIIICIGLWCIYSTCKQAGNQPLKTGGFTAIKVVMILKMIVSCIGYAFIIFTFAFLFLAAAAEGITMNDLMYSLEIAGSMGYGEADVFAGAASVIIIAFIFAVIVLFVTMILSIVYLAKIIGSLNRAKEIIVTGKTNKNVSAFVGVFLMISGILNVFVGLFGLNIATVLLGISSIIFATLIFSMRGIIHRG